MNSPMTILFTLATLMVLALGVLSVMNKNRLSIDYNHTASELYKVVAEKVGEVCATSPAPSITFTPNDAACDGDTSLTDVRGARRCFNLRGASAQVDFSSKPPVLRLLHNDQAGAKALSANLLSSYSGWMGYDDGGGGALDGLQRMVHTQASPGQGLWMTLAAADAGCGTLPANWEGAGLQPSTLAGQILTNSDTLACESWSEVARDDRGATCGSWYDSGPSSWAFGRRQRCREQRPAHC